MTLQVDLRPLDVEEGIAGRIVLAARAELAARGYPGLTMDELAHQLGISKKTIYAHFAGKEAIALAIVAAVSGTILRRTNQVLEAENLVFAARLRGVVGIIAEELGWVSAGLLRDLERHAPGVYAEIELLRGRNIGLVFGRLLGDGIRHGLVRPQIDPGFALAFWLQAINGLMQPASLARLGLDPREAFERAVALFLEGLLTEAGRDEAVRAVVGD